MSTQQFSNRTPPVEQAIRSITCGICQAVYSPAQDHMYLVQAPASSLEAAFMSMCHFCFRCRRPSCPSCWDHVHGVCASCVREMRLPFREELSPLRGTFFSPMRQAQETRINTSVSPLECVQPGQFQQDEHPAIDKAVTGPVRVVTATSAQSSLPDEQPTKQRTASSVAPSALASAQVDSDIDRLKTRPERSRRRSKPIERIVTLALLVILLIVVAVVVSALLSLNANAFIATVLHIDIRAEIAYLWQLITHLFA